MSELEKAMRNLCEKLSKEELTELVCVLMNDALHTRGPKGKKG